MIREGTIEDLKELLELGLLYWKEGNMQAAPYDRGVYAGQLLSCLTSDSQLLLVTEQGGRVVGFCLAELIHPIFSAASIVDVRLLYLLPSNRGGYSGPGMIKAVTRWAKANEAVYVQLGITSGINTKKTERLYTKLGYEHVGSEYRKEV